MDPISFDEATANKIWDILVAHCGASERGREDWIGTNHYHGITEYRFCGSLGFGGKFWADRFKVSCYMEDETPERLKAIVEANRLLKEVRDGSI